MLEMFLCSLFTIFPDYLFRRYIQGKRFGKEITIYSVWYELRWGITGCVILTVTPHYPDLLFPSLDQIRRLVLPDGSDPSRRRRPGGRGLCHFKGQGQSWPEDIQAGQHEAGSHDRGSNRKILEVDAQVEQAKVELAGSEGKIRRPEAPICRLRRNWTPSLNYSAAMHQAWRFARSRDYSGS